MGGGRDVSLVEVRVWCKKVYVKAVCVGFKFANKSLFLYQSICVLEKSPFNITHSRSEIEWSGLLRFTTFIC